MVELVTTPALPLGDTSSDAVARHTDSVRLDGQRRNLQIQWLRGLAATMVMVYHTASYQQLMLHNSTLIGLLGAGFGYFGVGLFFAISGYLMSIGIRVQSPFVFLVHRVIRIYPVYILMCALFWTLRSQFYGVSIDPASLLLVPFPGIKYSALTVEWTLVFEMAFYVGLFIVACCGGQRRITLIAAVWLALIGVNSLLAPDPGITLVMPVYRLLLNCACAPMAAGLLLPAALRLRVPSWLLVLVFAASWALGEHFHDTYEADRWFYGLSAVCLLWILLRVPEARAASTGRAGQVLSRYGDYSYALYLCHVPVIQLIYLSLPNADIYLLWSLCMATALAASVVFGQFDLSLYRRLKALVKRIPAPLVAGGMIAFAVVYAVIAAAGSVEYHRYYVDEAVAGTLARQIEASGPMMPASAAETMLHDGYAASDHVRGAVDKAEWFGDTGRMNLTAWAMTYPRDRHAQPVYLAVFRSGRLVTSGTPDSIRGDVLRAYGISLFRRTWAGRDFQFPAG